MLFAEFFIQQIRTDLSNVPKQMTGVSELQELQPSSGEHEAMSGLSHHLEPSLPSPPPLQTLWQHQGLSGHSKGHIHAQFQRIWCSWSMGNAQFPCTTFLAGLQVFPHTPAPGIFLHQKDAQESSLSDPVSLKKRGEGSCPLQWV